MARKQKGFTLIELLIVVADHRHPGGHRHSEPAHRDAAVKQKRTTADRRTIATAWEARATDVNKYNAAGAISVISACSNTVDITSLSGALAPTYIKLLPNKDGWGNKLKFYADQPWNDSKPAQNYIAWSAAKNGDSAGVGGLRRDGEQQWWRDAQLQRRHHLFQRCVAAVPGRRADAVSPALLS